MSKYRSIPGFGLTLGSTLIFLGLVTLLPMTSLVLKVSTMTWMDFWDIITDSRAVATYQLTFGSALIATLLNALLGLLVAWITVRYEFFGRRWLDSLIDLPFALPTAVAGISLCALTVPKGPIGQLLEPFGIQIAYAWPGVVLAMTFTSFPFVVRSLQPVIADLDPHLEEASHSLGATPINTFIRVVFPELLPALLAGATLAFVRSLGEFGAVIFISGNLPFKTEITTLLVFTRISEYDYPGAAALAFVLLLISFVILLSMNFIQHIFYRRMHP